MTTAAAKPSGSSSGSLTDQCPSICGQFWEFPSVQQNEYNFGFKHPSSQVMAVFFLLPGGSCTSDFQMLSVWSSLRKFFFSVRPLQGKGGLKSML